MKAQRQVWAARIAAALFFIAVTSAHAASWLYLGEPTTNTKVSMDVDGLRRSNGQVTVWVKYDHTKDKSQKARETKQFVRIDCNARTGKALSEIKYDSGGGVIESLGAMSFREVYIVPDSIGEMVLKAACEGNAD
jgi:hypothetical protein